MGKVIARLAGVVLAVVITCDISIAKYSGGTGEPNNPYRIATPNDLNAIGTDPNDWDKHFKLIADINLADYTADQFNLIGKYFFDSQTQRWVATPFTGVFDGNGHTILNFSYLSDTPQKVGLFTYVDGPNASISHVNFVDPNIIQNVSQDTGTLIGYFGNGAISHCHVINGTISGKAFVGGLVGYASRDTELYRCSFDGQVTGTWGVGALAGANNGAIAECHSTGEVEGANVGGLVGNHSSGKIVTSYSACMVVGTTYVGGLIGFSSAAVSDCYAGGSVSGTEGVGGLIGQANRCFVNNSYAYATVSGGTDVGGLLGSGSAHAFSSYWDVNATGQAESAAGTPKTTAQLFSADTYVGWGVDALWVINDGNDYARLWWENTVGVPITTASPIDSLGGNGTDSYPYLIGTPQELNIIGLFPSYWAMSFKLENDVDLSQLGGEPFNIIGHYLWPFTGVFDGDNYTISGFTLSGCGQFSLGLFGHVGGETPIIRNLVLREPDGSLIDLLSGAKVENCLIQNCHISTSNVAGGLVVTNDGGVISECHVTGTVSGGVDQIGGLVGRCIFGTIYRCSFTGSVSGSNKWIGGLVGLLEGSTVRQCYANSSVVGNSGVGSLIGAICYYESTIEDCYSTGSAYGYSEIGGFIGGHSLGHIRNCYSISKPEGDRNVGGFTGGKGPYASHEHVFWDNSSNPSLPGVGNVNDPSVLGLTTSQMQTLSTYTNAGWDFVGEMANGTEDIWDICNGTNYPKLAWQVPMAGDFACPDGVDFVDYGMFAEQWLLEKLAEDVAPNGGDGIVNFFDWAAFAADWKGGSDFSTIADFFDNWLEQSAYCADIAPEGGDDFVDWLDLEKFCENWLKYPGP